MWKIICEHCGDEIKFEEGPSFGVVDATSICPEDPGMNLPLSWTYCNCSKTCVLRFKREE